MGGVFFRLMIKGNVWVRISLEDLNNLNFLVFLKVLLFLFGYI